MPLDNFYNAGLSNKFLYLNDDTFLGAPVFVEDFYTAEGIHKVYLSWPVPTCARGCPSNWLGDGFCDLACNTTECGFDGGDCLGINGTVRSRYGSWCLLSLFCSFTSKPTFYLDYFIVVFSVLFLSISSNVHF